MWSRFNAVGMRQRWGAQETDPGRTCRASAEQARAPGDGGRRKQKAGITAGDGERVKREFLAREVVIDCPHPGCLGLYVTRSRELLGAPGSGSRVMLRCTRGDKEHELTLKIGGLEKDEIEALKSVLERGQQQVCPRCASGMVSGGGGEQTEAGLDAVDDGAHSCDWCGVKWMPRGRVQSSALW